ncbi:golvesin C-terminal-like domain-containing protein [Actinoplanes subglobosus]|uniref:Golvesin/Xly CBD-like domain-containing protein n=1 Tax=Actinoplanes subglobosus TaxID=1547892 RepID=A0ABV8IUK7_9ACTN
MHTKHTGILRRAGAVGLTLSLAAAVVGVPIPAAAAPPAAPAPTPDPAVTIDLRDDPEKNTVDPSVRDKVLRPGWKKSSDVAWTLNGDASGLHVLAATARTGYTWETVTTLAEPGFDADSWIGNACLTGSGRRLVVVYAPRTFTNKPDLFDRGGFTATVDLTSGKVTKLAVQTSLAYYNPGCGAAETAVLSQYGGERVDDPNQPVQSRMFTLDAAKGKLSAPIVLETELSSPVPVGDKVVAAGGSGLVEVDRSAKIKRLADTDGVAFRLVPDASGNVTFMDSAEDLVRVKRLPRRSGAKPAKLAEGPEAEIGLARGSGGRSFVTGTTTHIAALPSGVRRLSVPASSEVSATGDLALTRVRSAGTEDPRLRQPDPSAAEPARIDAVAPATGSALQFDVVTTEEATATAAENAAAAKGLEPSPALGSAAPQARVASAGSPSEASEGVDERYCAVARNDPQNQAIQPKPRQVEWAVDQVITGSLDLRREANWKNLGMPAYTLRQYFPRIELVTGGRIPAQIMLGVIAQESNMWQAARYALPGVTANPLIGNFYGRDIYNSTGDDDWDIHWADSDCGYGLTQVTDGMRLAGKEKTDDAGNKVETSLDYQVQRAVALDFAANVAAGARILQDKWNQTYQAGLKVHDANPAHLENWFFALWAYNSGMYQKKATGEPWGVGWLNNPINPRYDPQRKAFLEITYDDARTPQKWPYPEKILGWAGHPITSAESPTTDVAGYRAAWWSTTDARFKAKPDRKVFCNVSNDCDPNASVKPNDPDVQNEPAGPCLHKNASGLYDLRCWYHEPVAWKGPAGDGCASDICGAIGQACGTCGNEVLRFDPGYAYQDDGTSFPPKCDTSGLLPGAKVIDNIEKTVPLVRPCARDWTDGGDFSLNFASDSSGLYPSKVDLHQIGAGFGAHFWRGHTRQPGHLGGKLKVSGTWKLAESMTGWTRIQVSVPDHGAWSQQARYVIDLGNGQTRYRVVNQTWQQNRWVDLGVFPLSGRASVTLTNETPDGMGSDSIVFDAVAFTPTSKPAAQYVALGDSYSSGEGTAPYDRNSDVKRGNGGPTDNNACHRSTTGAYPRQIKLPGSDQTIEQQAAAGQASFAFLACSGATTTAVATEAVNNPPAASDSAGHTDWGSARFQHGEMTQVDQGYLDVDTTHVTISIGGNDARFAEVLRGCILRLADGCELDDYKLTRNNDKVDPEALNVYETKLIRDWLPAKLKATYRAIHRRAPNAKIVVVGYPQMRPDEEANGTCWGMSGVTGVFLNELTHHLTAATMKAVSEIHDEGVDIRYINSTLRWRIVEDDESKHWACQNILSGEDDARWTEAVLGKSEDGSGDSDPGAGSWHPNSTGQQQMAYMVNSVLRGDSPLETIKQRIIDYVDTRRGDRWTITDAQAADAAQRCLDLTRRGGMFDDPCMKIAIFFPTIADAASATRNDDAGLKRYPAWVVQNFASNEEKEKSWARGWLNEPRFGQTTCPTPRPAGSDGFPMECDEFPFFASEQGVAWAFHTGGEDAPISTQLGLTLKTENGQEGAVLNGLSKKKECNVKSAIWNTQAWPGFVPELYANGTPFLTVPLVADVHQTNKSFYIC